mmetsp:Transcript_2889/g.7010  ORF Transcript_2889/g.7010 Transcript_2889/m.7010 type:complete len:322 (-) Transcript_2889:400-1365(-)
MLIEFMTTSSDDDAIMAPAMAGSRASLNAGTKQPMAKGTETTLYIKAHVKFCLILVNVTSLMCIARETCVKMDTAFSLSPVCVLSITTTSAASAAALISFATARPTSACESASASLTPSPIKSTFLFFFLAFLCDPFSLETRPLSSSCSFLMKSALSKGLMSPKALLESIPRSCATRWTTSDRSPDSMYTSFAAPGVRNWLRKGFASDRISSSIAKQPSTPSLLLPSSQAPAPAVLVLSFSSATKCSEATYTKVSLPSMPPPLLLLVSLSTHLACSRATSADSGASPKPNLSGFTFARTYSSFPMATSSPSSLAHRPLPVS